ncbi:MAG: hypothetical protein HY730_07345 [Candidatus Tectomicrobia bacterium]|uniref:Uncharacterized protein n=1 Tax=Tectimicrobiota bacterium TaxID=2528274 RepID=A0A933LQY0_UNCTE|nr:hypothetical protein [Candidatus Tectomicrobia bacterium]
MIGETFEIKDLSGLVGRRTRLNWREAACTREAVDVDLPRLSDESIFCQG